MNHLSIKNMEQLKKNILDSGELEIFVTPEEEYDHPRDHFATGNSDDDEAIVQKILEDYEKGNEWAWCCVKVKVQYKGFSACDYLGGCSFKDEQDFKDSGYYDDMISEALYGLISNMVQMVNKGQEAEDLLINHLGMEI